MSADHAARPKRAAAAAAPTNYYARPPSHRAPAPVTKRKHVWLAEENALILSEIYSTPHHKAIDWRHLVDLLQERFPLKAGVAERTPAKTFLHWQYALASSCNGNVGRSVLIAAPITLWSPENQSKLLRLASREFESRKGNADLDGDCRWKFAELQKEAGDGQSANPAIAVQAEVPSSYQEGIIVEPPQEARQDSPPLRKVRKVIHPMPSTSSNRSTTPRPSGPISSASLPFSPADDRAILSLVQQHPDKFKHISRMLDPRRHKKEVKERWEYLVGQQSRQEQNNSATRAPNRRSAKPPFHTSTGKRSCSLSAEVGANDPPAKRQAVGTSSTSLDLETLPNKSSRRASKTARQFSEKVKHLVGPPSAVVSLPHSKPGASAQVDAPHTPKRARIEADAAERAIDTLDLTMSPETQSFRQLSPTSPSLRMNGGSEHPLHSSSLTNADANADPLDEKQAAAAPQVEALSNTPTPNSFSHEDDIALLDIYRSCAPDYALMGRKMIPPRGEDEVKKRCDYLLQPYDVTLLFPEDEGFEADGAMIGDEEGSRS